MAESIKSSVPNAESTRKVSQVDSELKRLCMQKQLKFIDHANISCHELNGSKIHLNKVVTKVLVRNFTGYIYNNTDWGIATWEFASNIDEFLSTYNEESIPDVDESYETESSRNCTKPSKVVW